MFQLLDADVEGGFPTERDIGVVLQRSAEVENGAVSGGVTLRGGAGEQKGITRKRSHCGFA